MELAVARLSDLHAQRDTAREFFKFDLRRAAVGVKRRAV
jgi:hypothetical protein